MVKRMNMNLKKAMSKYLIILLVYVLIIRFVQPYGLRLYYTLSNDPDMMVTTHEIVQAIYALITFSLNLIIVILMAIDAKRKKAIDWLILVITFFSVETGICMFFIWQFYKLYLENARPNHA